MRSVTAHVEERVRDLIETGTVPAGSALPSERALAAELSAGRTTIRLVLSKLAAEGLIRAEHGRGYIVLSTEAGATRAKTREELEPWTVRGARTIYDNPWVKLDLVDVEPPGGKRFEHHVVRLSRVSITAVIDDADRVLMLWRYRFVPDRWGWELPGGIVDDGEDPAETAAREVEEETGWRPRKVNHLLSYEPMVGMVESPHEIFTAHGATYIGAPTDVEEAGIVEWIPLSEIPDLLKQDKLLGSGTLMALLHILAFGAEAA